MIDHVTIRVSDRDASKAGYADNGAPGERAIYHEALSPTRTCRLCSVRVRR